MKIILFIGSCALAGLMLGGLAAYSSFETLSFDAVASDAGITRDARYPSLPPLDGPQPVAYTARDEFDFGEMKKHESGSFDFKITNRGNYDLELRKGPTSCTCTLSGLDKALLAPGESTDVTLSWEVKTQLSFFTQTAQVFTSDRTHRTIVFKITGTVIKTLVGIPEGVSFTKATTEQSHLRAFPLVSEDLEDFQIVDYELENPDTAEFFKVNIEPVGDGFLQFLHAKSGVMVTVIVEPGLPIGLVEQTLILHTNSKEDPQIVIQYHGTVRGDVSVAGPGWNDASNAVDEVSGVWRFLGRISGKKGSTRKLVILLRGPHRNEMQLRVASVEPSFLKVSLGEPKGLGNNLANQVRLSVEIPAGTPPNNFTGGPLGGVAEIVIETGASQPARIRLQPLFLVEE